MVVWETAAGPGGVLDGPGSELDLFLHCFVYQPGIASTYQQSYHVKKTVLRDFRT